MVFLEGGFSQIVKNKEKVLKTSITLLIELSHYYIHTTLFQVLLRFCKKNLDKTEYFSLLNNSIDRSKYLIVLNTLSFS